MPSSRHQENQTDIRTGGDYQKSKSALGMPRIRFVYTMELGEGGRLLDEKDVLGWPLNDIPLRLSYLDDSD